MIDVLTYAALRNYIDEKMEVNKNGVTINHKLPAVKITGKEETEDGSINLTFTWASSVTTDGAGNPVTSNPVSETITIPPGRGIDNVSVNSENHLILEMNDDTEIDAGQISLALYATKEEVEEVEGKIPSNSDINTLITNKGYLTEDDTNTLIENKNFVNEQKLTNTKESIISTIETTLEEYATKEDIRYFISNEAAGELDDAVLAASKKYVDDSNFAKLSDISDMATNTDVASVKSSLESVIAANKQKAAKDVSDLKAEVDEELETIEASIVSTVDGKLANLVAKSSVYTKTEIDNKLESKLGFEIVTDLPSVGETNKLYFKKIEGTKQYLLFKYIDGEFVSC